MEGHSQPIRKRLRKKYSTLGLTGLREAGDQRGQTALDKMCRMVNSNLSTSKTALDKRYRCLVCLRVLCERGRAWKHVVTAHPDRVPEVSVERVAPYQVKLSKPKVAHHVRASEGSGAKRLRKSVDQSAPGGSLVDRRLGKRDASQINAAAPRQKRRHVPPPSSAEASFLPPD